ncbi:hypothetical protein TTHERM_01169520 (macronuclear) [Tetrahymena thermophila SB210]|uniref:EGF-like domain-containing protein n=1 Tax=Tetrahymena thermophila (strain SB210) TaxID=312017 RepID=Q22AQ1_TETTS|nr:hypothetical protein TTHERM_01169520 [Tetrahymena thermophila SB210]EAR82384.2 hypothetical protein TTHERM_01169520 [Tetrahymena thermophila SB210]|eukprot:XP_001030047.2 hypothetical protein TTHERM_01169520 [Tetrahymena thermophila SB210]
MRTKIQLNTLNESSFLFLIINLFFIKISHGLEVLYDVNFTQQSIDCNGLFSSGWSTVGTSFINGSQCSLQCTRSDTNGNISLLSLNPASYPSGFKLEQQITQPYSIIGADIVYSLDQSQMQISMIDGVNIIQSQTISSTREIGQFGINYSVNCPSYDTNRKTYITSLLYKQKLSSNSIILQFQQQQLSSTQSQNLMGIAQIRLWANCVQNCQVCTDSTNCQKCFPGFQVTSLPSGQRVCEQTFNACQASCDTCNNSIDNSVSICNICIYGYMMNGSNVCVPLKTCPINQYFSYASNSCVNYTNKCYIQTSYKTNQWASCDGQVDPGVYRCGLTTSILIYDWQNYKLAKCGCPDSYCTACLNSSNKCYQCQPGYSITGSQTQCTYTGSCPANYYFEPNSQTCQPICSTNCDYCTLTSCIYCKRDQNYYITSSNYKNCAVCSIQNCNKCNGSGQCSQCIQGYYLSIDYLKCETCQVSNCAKCSVFSNICLTCNLNYSLANNQCLCKQNNSCQICDSTDGSLCLTCFQGYTYNSIQKTCSCSLLGCTQCKPQDGTKCQANSCQIGYTYDSISQTCICGVQNCATCNPTNGQICDGCIAGYQAVGKSQCQCNLSNCASCNPLNGNECSVCKNGYSLNSTTKICQSNIPYCQTNNQIDVSKCDVCQQYYTQNQSQTKCIPIISNCLYIDSNNNCTQCAQNYLLQDNTCTCNVQYCQQCDPNDGSQCITCNSFYNKSQTNQQCISSISSCELINSSGVCSQCVNGYQLDLTNNQCICTVNNCNQCNAQDGTKCDQCNSNYLKLFNNTKCLKSIQNCLDYNSDGSCKTCVQDYLYNPIDNTCNCAIQNCQSCNMQSGSICDSCYSFYNLDMINKNLCAPSIQNCQAINSSGICTQCAQGFNYDSINNTCNCSVQNCLQCSAQIGTICQICSSGYLPNSTNTICQLQTQNCLEFNKSNNQCIKCQQGYTFDQINNICICSAQNCIQCSLSDGSQCINCQKNYLSINNQCICQAKNCSQCSVGDGLLCSQCQSNFFLYPKDSQCYQNCQQNQIFNPLLLKCEQCQISNCLKCKDFDSSHCLQCNDGYNLDNPQKCSLIEVCQVLKCKQCSQTDLTKCSICQDNYVLDNNQQCNNQFTNSFRLSQNLLDSGYLIYINFNSQIALSNLSIDQLISIQINNFNNFQVTSYQLVNNQQIKATLQVTSNCKQNTLTVSIIDNNFAQINNLLNRQDSILLSDFVILSSQQRQQAQAIKDTANTIQSSLLSSILPIAILGNFYVLFNMIDHTTFLYFLLFVNVRHPQNILNFCSIFQNFQMAFIPNVFNVYLMDQGYSQNYTPKKFLEQQCDAYFLNEAGQSIFIISCIMFIYFCLKILYLFDTPFKSYIEKKIQSGWEYCGFIDLFAFVQVYVFLGVLLQFFSFEFVESLNFLNYSLFSVGLIGSFLIPMCIFLFLHKCKDLTTPQVQQQFSSIVGGLRIASPQEIKEANITSKRVYYQLHYIKYNYIFLTIRKLLFCILLVFMHDYPYVQIPLIVMQNLILSFYYLYLWPHDKGYENIRNAISEYLLIGMELILVILVKDDQDQNESQRFFYGWIFISLAITLMSIHFISVIIDFVKLIFRLLSFVILFIKSTVQFLIRYYKQSKVKNDNASVKNQKQDLRNSKLFISAHLKTIAQSLDQTFTSSTKKVLFERNQVKNHSILKNKKLKHILASVNVVVPSEHQIVRFSSRKGSQNNSFEHQKDDSTSNFYNSGVFCSSTRSVAQQKLVAFQNNENKDENQNQKSTFFQMQSPPAANMSSFEFNPFTKSLIDQQLSIRGNSTFQKSSKFNSPNSSFQEENDQSINQ